MSDYSYWRKALEGEFGPIHDGHPQPGFYRHPLCSKINVPWCPIAIWPDEDGKLLAMKHVFIVEQPVIVPAEEVWTFCCDNPISEEAYRAVAENKLPWPSGTGITRKRLMEISK
jgi:hypothetical protein